jgi:hypothetical protein
MKVCFYLQRRFAFLGHEMAVLLKEKYGVKDFCGYVKKIYTQDTKTKK